MEKETRLIKEKEEDNLVLGMYAKSHEDYERMIACCLGVK